MVNIEFIEKYYPPELRVFKRNILREYLQYKILDILAMTPEVNNLVFIGGTAIRIVYDGDRFSEDLDFDNLNLNKKEFIALMFKIKKGLEFEGYEVDISTSFKDAFHCFIDFKNILYENKISPHINEKLTIRIDAQPQNYDYKKELKLITKFDIFSRVFVVPENLLLSHKLYALINRKRTMARDIFDILFLGTRVKPDINYLIKRLKLKDTERIKEKLILKCKDIDFDKISKDLLPFVFREKDIHRIKLFPLILQKLF